MGQDRTNIEYIAHRDAAGSTNDYRARVHHANDGIDVVSQPATAAQHASLKAAAAQSQTAFDQAATAVWPVFYPARTAQQKSLIRDVIGAL